MLALFAWTLCLAQQQLDNESPRFSLRLPPGYTLAKEELPLNRFYVREGMQGVRFVATVSLLSSTTAEGEIARRREELAQGMSDSIPGRPPVRSAIRRLPWKGNTIEVLELRYPRDGISLVATMAFVPTAPQSVRVEVLGPEPREGEVFADLEEIVRSLEGRSSWLTPEDFQSMRFAPLPTVISMIAAPVYILAWILFFRRKPRRLLRLRIAWMLVMGVLPLLSPLRWSDSLREVHVGPPAVCTWPLAAFLAAPWLMLGTARLAALLLEPKPPPIQPGAGAGSG